VALLYLLISIKKEFKLDLVVGHLDHGLREESLKDRQFVFEIGRKLNIPVVCERVNLKESKVAGSLEEIARLVRLDFFKRLCREFRLEKVALGHNKDDQAETVLMRILRGTGLLGLAAIQPKRGINGLEIIRPLINIERREIERYLKNKRIVPVVDKTNLKEVFFRNRIRNFLLPELARYNPNIKEILANMAKHAGSDYDFLLTKAKRRLKALAISVSRNRVNLDLAGLLRCHPAMFRLVLRLAYSHVKGDTRRLSFRHLEELEALAFTRPLGSVVDLPKNISARKGKKFLSVYLSKG